MIFTQSDIINKNNKLTLSKKSINILLSTTWRLIVVTICYKQWYYNANIKKYL